MPILYLTTPGLQITRIYLNKWNCALTSCACHPFGGRGSPGHTASMPGTLVDVFAMAVNFSAFPIVLGGGKSFRVLQALPELVEVLKGNAKTSGEIDLTRGSALHARFEKCKHHALGCIESARIHEFSRALGDEDHPDYDKGKFEDLKHRRSVVESATLPVWNGQR